MLMFDLNTALTGVPLITRGGLKAGRLTYSDMGAIYPLRCHVKFNETPHILEYSFTEDGKRWGCKDNVFDLFIAEESDVFVDVETSEVNHYCEKNFL